MIAWRSGQRYAERLCRASLDPSRHRPAVRDGAAYIVTGGLGGLGLVVARWLVDSGAGRVVLNGRSGPSDEQRQVLAQLETRAEIAIVTGDIAEPGVAERLVAAAEATALELRGVVHAAAVIDDSLMIAMSRDSLERVWAPKAAGAVRLHEATPLAATRLVGRVLLGSLPARLARPGGLCKRQRLARRPGRLAQRFRSDPPPRSTGDRGRRSASPSRWPVVSLDPITPTEGIEALESLLGTDRTMTGVARLRTDRALAAFPEIRGLGYFTRVVEEVDLADDGGDWAGPDALRGMAPRDAQRIVTDRLRDRIAAVMGYADHAAVDTGPAADSRWGWIP